MVRAAWKSCARARVQVGRRNEQESGERDRCFHFWRGADEEEQINTISREQVESGLEFAGFLVFHCPLKPDAISTIRDLNDSSHRCVMITGDNPLTAAHVAKEVEIVDREVLILDHREGSADEAGSFLSPSGSG